MTKVYNASCPHYKSASTMTEIMYKNSLRCVFQIAINMFLSIFFVFFNSPSELTFWITLIFKINIIKSEQTLVKKPDSERIDKKMKFYC